jgi:hypothetical protein
MAGLGIWTNGSYMLFTPFQLLRVFGDLGLVTLLALISTLFLESPMTELRKIVLPPQF